MRIKNAARVAAVVVASFVAVACATPDVTGTVTPPPAEGGTEVTTPGEIVDAGPQSVTLGFVNMPIALHGFEPNSANNQLQYLINGPGFAFFDPDLNYVRNTDFGTFDEVSTDEAAGTRTVRYTINDGVTWSDGTPVDAADMILAWATSSGRFIPEDGNFNWLSPSTSMGTVSEFPIISDDGRTITFTYDDLRSDWYLQFGSSSVPAHIVARRAFGIQDPEEAKQALITAFGGPENFRAQDGTETPDVTTTINAALGPITTFVAPNVDEIAEVAGVVGNVDGTNVNNWVMSSFPTGDEDLLITMGPYQVAEWLDGEFIRLERNPNFNWYGSVVERPNVDEIIVRAVGNDPVAAIQALQNGEVDMVLPQANIDSFTMAENLVNAGEPVRVIGGQVGTFEHVTLIMDNDGPFDPSYWGGDADKARAARLAFLFTIPREEIVERLIAPINPDADVRHSFSQIVGSPTYPAVIANNSSAEFNVQDLDRAAEVLADAGITEADLPIPVRFLTANDNQRRIDAFQLIQAAVDGSGLFEIVDARAPSSGEGSWGAVLRQEPSVFDATMFAWGATSTSPNNSQSNFTFGFANPGQEDTNNIGGFNDDVVNDAWRQILVSGDEAEITRLQGEFETRLFEEGFGAPLFQWPGLMVVRDHIENVSAVPFGMENLWNFWQWNIPAGH